MASYKDRFLYDLQEHFRLSTTENVKAKHTFQSPLGETLERMFARFNMLAKPLEEKGLES